MSGDVTPQTAIEAAIDAWVTENVEGAIVTGYVLTVAATTATDADDRAHYLHVFPDSQPLHTALGLARLLTLQLEAEENRT